MQRLPVVAVSFFLFLSYLLSTIDGMLRPVPLCNLWTASVVASILYCLTLILMFPLARTVLSFWSASLTYLYISHQLVLFISILFVFCVQPDELFLMYESL